MHRINTRDLVEKRTSELEIINSRLKHEIDELKQAMNLLSNQYHKEQELYKQLEIEVIELKNTEKKQKDQMRQRADFMKIIVHELKTPLTPLLSISDLLINQNNDNGLAENLERLNRGIIKMNNRIDELMDLCKGEVGRLEIEKEKVDLMYVINNTVSYFEPHIIKKGQNLINEIPNSLPIVIGNSERLSQVLTNLLDNASKFTPNGGQIVVRAYTIDSNVTVEVQNSGVYLTEEQQHIIFNPYQRLPNHNSMGGLGLGLSLSKMLIELQGGHIFVKSILNQGNIFGFCIPVLENSSISS